MMDDRDLDLLLLGRGALSRREREEVLEQVLNRVARHKKAGHRRAFAMAAVGIAACVTVALALNRHPREDGTFGPRGGAGASAYVELECLGGSLSACPRGSHVLFAASGGVRPGYLAAYGEPIGGGERIWYFSSEHLAPAIAPGPGAEKPVDRAIEIGAEHRIGRYSVHVLVSTRPLSREQALHPDPGSILTAETVEMGVVR